MAKNITTKQSLEQIALQIHDYGLRGKERRVIDLIKITDAEFFSFAFTENADAVIVVIAKESFYDVF